MICSKCGNDNTGSPNHCQSCGWNLYTKVSYAGFTERLIAFLIDAIIIFFLVAVPVLFLWVIFSFIFYGIYDVAFMALLLLLPGLYFAYYESSKSMATPGKMVMGLAVVDDYGDRLSYLRSSGRYFGRLLSALLLGLGFVMILQDKEKKGLHDKIAGTYVISTSIKIPFNDILSQLPVIKIPAVKTTTYHVHMPQNSLLLNGTSYPLAYDTKLRESNIPGLTSGQGTGIVADVIPNRSDPSLLGLRNLSLSVWTVYHNGNTIQISPGFTIKISPGVRINFGTMTGEIR